MSKPTTWPIFIAALLLSLVIYFLPTIIARKKPFFLKLFFLNLLLGWTLLGWVIALIWAFKKQKKLSEVQSNINNSTIAQIEKLNQLRKDGILTDEEVDGQKQKLTGNETRVRIQPSTKQKLQIVSAIIMVFVMLICLTCYLYIVPKYIYGEEAIARQFLNSVQAGSLDSNLTQANYISETNQSIFPQIAHYSIQTIKRANNNQYIVYANISGHNNKGAWISQQAGVLVQKNYDQYKIIDTYNLLIIHDGKIVFPADATDLQKTEALQDLPNNLQIIDWQYRLNNGSVLGTGVIKNNANYPVKFIEAEIKYTNQKNQIIKANKIYVVDDNELNPGESRGFNSNTPNCNDCNNANIYILNNNN